MDEEIYEIEFDSRGLKKGDVLSTAFCEKHLKMNRDSDGFQLAVNRLANGIQQVRTDLIVSPKAKQIRVLTDNEAEVELLDRARQLVRKELTLSSLHGRVNRDLLTEQNQKVHDNMTAYHGMRAIEAWKAQRKLQETSNILELLTGEDK